MAASAIKQFTSWCKKLRKSKDECKDQWFIKRDDGRVDGPLGTAKMREAFTNEEVTAATLVRKDNADGGFAMVQDVFPNVHLAFAMRPRTMESVLAQIKEEDVGERQWPAKTGTKPLHQTKPEAVVEDAKEPQAVGTGSAQLSGNKKSLFGFPVMRSKTSFEVLDDDDDTDTDTDTETPVQDVTPQFVIRVSHVDDLMAPPAPDKKRTGQSCLSLQAPTSEAAVANTLGTDNRKHPQDVAPSDEAKTTPESEHI